MLAAEGNHQAGAVNVCFNWICYSSGLVAPVLSGITSLSTSRVRLSAGNVIA
ncbi:hypothetical protein PanABDRAFT_4248 [Pantoea sp. aB]|jgi:hypothetical protein|nr:hypothetical protein PanABDRAFT_4248 [Pantoea sp. aB]